MERILTTPMHKHRARSNEVSLKMRLAASKNVRTRHKDGMRVTVAKAPWERKPERESKK